LWVTLAQLVPNASDPLYVAVTMSLPLARDFTFSVATPPLSFAVPTTTPPTVKVTVPVAVPDAALTVAVNVTPLPCLEECDDWDNVSDVDSSKLTPFDGSEAALVPAALVADTVKV